MGYGFDTVADVQSLSPAGFEKLLETAERVAGSAIVVGSADEPPLVRLEGEALKADFDTRGTTGATTSTARARSRPRSSSPPGEYALRVEAYGEQAGPEPGAPRRGARRRAARALRRRAEEGEPGTYEARFRVEENGRHRLSARLRERLLPARRSRPRAARPQPGRDRRRGRGPVRPAADRVPAQRWIRRGDPRTSCRACSGGSRRARGAAPRASRPTWNAWSSSRSRSPRRWPARAGRWSRSSSRRTSSSAWKPPPAADGAAARDLDELASPRGSRTSCGAACPTRSLQSPRGARRSSARSADVLRAQAHRMLRDARSSALVEQLRRAVAADAQPRARLAPDPERFPAFDEACASAMRAETEMFFEAVLREDRRIGELLDSDFTFLNERLAEHYGIPGVRGDQMRRVHLRAGRARRRARLRPRADRDQQPDAHVPVKRGKWILETLLDAADAAPAARAWACSTRAPRQRTRPRCASGSKRTATNADCAACHARLDPLGFGLENFDAIGAWRATRRTVSDRRDSATLPDGRAFRRAGRAEGACCARTARSRAASRRSCASTRSAAGLTRDDEAAIETRSYARSVLSPTLGDGDPGARRDSDLVPHARGRGQDERMKPRASRAAPCCAASARRWRCRSSSRWPPARPRCAEPTEAPRRLVFVYVPNGVHMDGLDAGGRGRRFGAARRRSSRWRRSATRCSC